MEVSSGMLRDEFILELLSAESFVEAMSHFAAFFRKKTAAEDIMLYGVRALDMTLGYFFQDRHCSVLEPFSLHVKKFFSWNEISSNLYDRDARIYLNNAVSANDKSPDYCISTSSQLYQSVMTLYLGTGDAKKFICAFSLASRKKNQFASEHAQLLKTFSAPLTAIIRKLIFDNDLIEIPPSPLLGAGNAGLLDACPDLRSIMRDIGAIAPLKASVLVYGQTGTGKELAAEVIHTKSGRKGNFVKVNCGAIPDTLLASELFGHEKGAFTGAVARHIGAFEQADRGTLFLDEVGELSPQAQIHLLRVLERREITRVGSTTSIPVDVRIIAATHRRLPTEVQEGRFREDLWYRLSAFVLEIPPLVRRKADIPGLVRYFYTNASVEMGIDHPPKLTGDVIRGCMLRPWPGNVRQLRNSIERSLVLSIAHGQTALTIAPIALQDEDVPHKRRRDIRQDEIVAALEKSSGRIQGIHGAAAALGVAPSSLRNKMKQLGIPLPRQKRVV